jgi:hypothetical protein
MNGRRFLNVSSGGVGAEATARRHGREGIARPGRVFYLRTSQARGTRAATRFVRGAGVSSR